MINTINLFNYNYRNEPAKIQADKINKVNDLIFRFNPEYSSDGIIGDFSQSTQRGDCYLLASLYSLSKTSKGAEILKNNIKKENNGSFTISLPGAKIIRKDYEKNKKKCCISGTYTITQAEIKRARKSGKYSKGDLDVLLYELAFEKYRKEVISTNKMNNQGSQYGIAGQYAGNGTNADPLKGGVGHDAMFVLTGKQSMDYEVSASTVASINSEHIKTVESRKKKKLSKQGIERLLDNKAKNPERYSITFGLKLDGKSYHALSINKVENGRVYFVNPWNSKKEFSLSIKEFMRSAYQISVVDMETPSLMDNIVDGAYNTYGSVINFISDFLKK